MSLVLLVPPLWCFLRLFASLVQATQVGQAAYARCCCLARKLCWRSFSAAGTWFSLTSARRGLACSALALQLIEAEKYQQEAGEKEALGARLMLDILRPGQLGYRIAARLSFLNFHLLDCIIRPMAGVVEAAEPSSPINSLAGLVRFSSRTTG